MVKIYITNDNKLAIYDYVSLLQENIHQQKIINRLSRKIQKKNQLIKIIEDEKAEFVLRYIFKKERIEKALELLKMHNEMFYDNSPGYIQQAIEILKGGSNE